MHLVSKKQLVVEAKRYVAEFGGNSCCFKVWHSPPGCFPWLQIGYLCSLIICLFTSLHDFPHKKTGYIKVFFCSFFLLREVKSMNQYVCTWIQFILSQIIDCTISRSHMVSHFSPSLAWSMRPEIEPGTFASQTVALLLSDGCGW